MVIGGINKEVFVEGVMRKLRNEGEKEQNEGIDNRQELRVKIEDVADSLLKFRLSNEESYNKKNEVTKLMVVVIIRVLMAVTMMVGWNNGDNNGGVVM